MQAGRLDRRIRIEEIGLEVDDGLRTKPGGWFKLHECWAELVPLSGAEKMAAGEGAAFRTLKFRIRRPRSVRAIAAKDRLVYDNQVHDIAAAFPVGRDGLEILCVARADADPDSAADGQP